MSLLIVLWMLLQEVSLSDGLKTRQSYSTDPRDNVRAEA